MIRKILVMATVLAIPTFGTASSAQAEEYCREYTKTVSIGGRAERAYGTACYKPDGSWEIVTLQGSNYGRDQVREVIYDDLHRRYDRGNRVVIVDRHHYRPHYTRAAYRSPLSLSFFFGDHDHDHDRKKYYKEKVIYKKHHGHGYGHSKHHGKGHDRHHRR